MTLGRPSLALAFACAPASLAMHAGCNSAVDLGANTDAGVEAASSGGDAGDAATPATCEGVCAKLEACGYVAADKRDACLAECRQKGTTQELECAAREPCDRIPSVCGNGPGADAGDAASPIDQFEIRNCQEGCDTAKFYSCIDAATQATCRDLCTTATAAKRNAYASCASGAGGRCPEQVDCYDQFTK